MHIELGPGSCAQQPCWCWQIVEALKTLGLGPAAEAELRRMERQGKRPREPEPAAAPAANKQIKLDPRLANKQVCQLLIVLHLGFCVLESICLGITSNSCASKRSS